MAWHIVQCVIFLPTLNRKSFVTIDKQEMLQNKHSSMTPYCSEKVIEALTWPKNEISGCNENVHKKENFVSLWCLYKPFFHTKISLLARIEKVGEAEQTVETLRRPEWKNADLNSGRWVVSPVGSARATCFASSPLSHISGWQYSQMRNPLKALFAPQYAIASISQA